MGGLHRRGWLELATAFLSVSPRLRIFDGDIICCVLYLHGPRLAHGVVLRQRVERSVRDLRRLEIMVGLLAFPSPCSVIAECIAIYTIGTSIVMDTVDPDCLCLGPVGWQVPAQLYCRVGRDVRLA